MSKNKANHTESRNEQWRTPQGMYDKLDSVFDFKIDLCASHENHKCSLYITEEMDLMSPAIEDTIEIFSGSSDYLWINPPYKTGGGTGKFVGRAVELAGPRGLVCLVPASVGSKWWVDHIWAHFETVIFPRRFNFEGAPGSCAMFDCAICIKWVTEDREAKAWKTLALKNSELGTIAVRP